MSGKSGSSLSSDEREDFKCPVCWEIACEPLCLKPCDHFICKRCHQSLRNSNSANSCPVCRSNIAKTMPFREMERKMAKLEEKCPGCQESVALSTMKQHVLQCPTLLNLEKCSNQSNSRTAPPVKSAPRNGSKYGFVFSTLRPESYDDEEHIYEEIRPVQRRSFRHSNDDDENHDEFSRQDNQHLRPLNYPRPMFRYEDNRGQHRQCKGRGRGRGRGIGVHVPIQQRRDSHEREQMHYEDIRPMEGRSSEHSHSDDERYDEFSQQDNRHIRLKNPQKPAYYFDVNGVEHPHLNGGQSGSSNTNGRNGQQTLAQIQCNQRRRKDMQRKMPEPGVLKNSNGNAECAGGASPTPGAAYLDPSKGARPKCQPNTQRSDPMQDPSRTLPATTTVSAASSACGHASASSRARSDNDRYMCPYCGEVGMHQVELVNHCLDQHSSEKSRVVCPICASMPWGNPNQLSAGFIPHLQKRHAFDYKDYVLNGDDGAEEAMLARALEASLQDFGQKS